MPDLTASNPLSIVGYVNERYGTNLDDNHYLKNQYFPDYHQD